jgi:hypothetical protein
MLVPPQTPLAFCSLRLLRYYPEAAFRKTG